MASQFNILIIGGEGIIGSYLSRRLREIGQNVTSTTHKKNNNGNLHFDLLDKSYSTLLSCKPDIVIVCAAKSNIMVCETNPVLSKRINVYGTVNLIKIMLSLGVYVIFLSSNAVFDGNTPYVNEDHLCNPTTEYGRQKALAEKLLLGLPCANTNLAIVRLTKVLYPNGGIANYFLTRLKVGHYCEAFSDLQLCPVSIEYVINGLVQITMARNPGIFHMTGAKELSYMQLASLFASNLKVKKSLVVPIMSNERDVDILFRPKHPSLGMIRTERVLGLHPETISQMIKRLMYEFEL